MAAAHDYDITELLAQVQDDDTDALRRLIPLVYEELRAMAHHQRHRNPSDTLNTTAIVHEAYEKLIGGGRSFADRKHFFRIAARAMRDVVLDYAKSQKRLKRGGGHKPLSIDELRIVQPEQSDQLLALAEALTQLRQLDDRQAEIVELRYFVGLTIAETAEVLDLSCRTVKRDWSVARAWLRRSLSRAA